METVNRRITFCLYPKKKQRKELDTMRLLHQQLYNGALEERIQAYKKYGISITYSKQCLELTELRASNEEYRNLNAQSEQLTLKRLALAYSAFFRRLKENKKKRVFLVSNQKIALKASGISLMAMAGNLSLEKRM